MICSFSEIGNEEVYLNSGAIFACGSHPIFTSIVVDRAKDLCKGDFTFDIEMGDTEFGGIQSADSLKAERVGSLNFDDFIGYVRTPSIFGGRWVCSVSYSSLTKGQKDTMWKYIRKPNKNGLLVIIVSDYKDIRDVRQNSVVKNSKEITCLNVEYPTSEALQNIVKEMFEQRGLGVDERSVKYFISRISAYYDDYALVMDQICGSYPAGTEMDIRKMKEALKGKENYMFDDFMASIVKPCSGDRRCKVFKMASNLSEAYGINGLRKRMIKYVDRMILYRLAINQGKIPVLVRISVAEAKENLGEKHPIYKDNDIVFKKRAYLASRTSLKDWVFIKLILSNVSRDFDNLENNRAVLAALNRWTLANDRLMNAIGVKDTLSEGLVELNGINYRDLIDTSKYDKALQNLLNRREELKEQEQKKKEQKNKREAKKVEKENEKKRMKLEKNTLADIYRQAGLLV